ncbi:hypothetical protein BKA59DRAFT_457149 [Fusarium tricinctum]|uniref:Uncharacterized protein n=2 Tax=Fusarium tricinctum species complex TaxID=679429 RepID=A0A8K0RVD3_9HYPO|nr:hypothetical protein BKA59DRAFT_457149 [Fusarium tricinctum]
MRFISDDRKVDPKAAQMQVLALGLSRCATSSLQAALESDVIKLGPCLHMAHIAPHADRERIVIQALREPDAEKRQKLLHKIFDGYSSTCDFPGWAFSADLMDMYPDSLVILNKRKSGEVWLKSIGDTLRFFGTWRYLLPTYLWTTDRLHYQIHQEAYAWGRRIFGSMDLYSAEFYDAYFAWVRGEADKRGMKVLEWQVQDGWGPLCEFLDKDEPKDRPFPNLNDAKEMNVVKKILIARGLISWGLLAGLGWAGWKFGPDMVEKRL